MYALPFTKSSDISEALNSVARGVAVPYLSVQDDIRVSLHARTGLEKDSLVDKLPPRYSICMNTTVPLQCLGLPMPPQRCRQSAWE